MTDLICRKTMLRCQTPGMCRPHGGCRPDQGFEAGHLDLGKFVDWVWNLKAERDQLKAENEALRKDAERYRGVRRVANRQGFTDEQFDQQTDTRIASFDAAMAKEVSHG